MDSRKDMIALPFRMELEVLAHDIDVHCIARPSSVLRYMQETVDHNFLSAHPTYQELLAEHKSFIISRAAIKVYKPLMEYDRITVETWATATKTATFPRSYRVIRNGETVAESLMSWALVDTDSRRFIRGSEFDVTPYGTGDPIALDMPSRFKIPAEAELILRGSKRVYYSDIDRNMHMNNTRYLDILFDHLPGREELYMTSALINFVHEAPYGKELEIYISDAGIDESGEYTFYCRTVMEGQTNIEAVLTARRVRENG